MDTRALTQRKEKHALYNKYHRHHHHPISFPLEDRIQKRSVCLFVILNINILKVSVVSILSFPKSTFHTNLFLICRFKAFSHLLKALLVITILVLIYTLYFQFSVTVLSKTPYSSSNLYFLFPWID